MAGGANILKTIHKLFIASLSLLIVLTPYLLHGSLLLASPTAVAAWPQDAGNAQRTGYTAEDPNTPWTFLWSWNGPDANGRTGNHFYDAPREARTVAADNRLFAPAGARGLYALNLTNGAQLWHVDAAAFMAAPAYAGGMVYAGGANGTLYKIDAANGRIVGSYNTGSPINKAILVVGSAIYTVSDDGRLHKVNSSDMSAAWVYAAGSTIATLPSYSATRDAIIYATDDLYVHAVNNGDGTRKWRVKPSPAPAGGTSQQTVAGTYLGAQFDLAWPVVADAGGIVLLRMQLPHQALFEGPNEGLWSTSNAENRAWLQANPQWQNLFALSLDSGAKAFVPIVGYGSTEDYVDGGSQGAGTQGVMGSQPVVRTLPDGNEVAYIHFRNGQHDSDFRWSGHMGEMVLDDTTVAGLAAGDLRFVDTHQTDQIVDEQNPLTFAGDTLLHSHWAAVVTHVITNRSEGLGLSKGSPIATTRLPSIVRAMKACGAAPDSTTHWTTGACGGLSYVTDGGRHFDGPGWWGYWDVADPPGWRVGSGNSAGTSYSAGFLPRYTYVAEGKVVVSGNGGELLVFSHSSSGSPATPVPTHTPTATPTPTPTTTPTPIPGATATPTATPTRNQNPGTPDPPTPIPTPTLPPVPCSPERQGPGVEARCFQFFLPFLQTEPR